MPSSSNVITGGLNNTIIPGVNNVKNKKSLIHFRGTMKNNFFTNNNHDMINNNNSAHDTCANTMSSTIIIGGDGSDSARGRTGLAP